MNWFASILIILGYVFLVYKNKFGFLIQSTGCVYFILAYINIDNAIVLTNTVFTAINIAGFYKWSKQ